MPLDPLHGLHPSPEARCLFACLYRRGGSMRIGPLLRGLGSLGIDQHSFVDAVFELGERYWITVVWRKAAPGATAEEEPAYRHLPPVHHPLRPPQISLQLVAGLKVRTPTEVSEASGSDTIAPTASEDMVSDPEGLTPKIRTGPRSGPGR